VKVPSPISSKQAVRGLVAVSLAWVLAAGGAAAPVMAAAEEAPAASAAPIAPVTGGEATTEGVSVQQAPATPALSAPAATATVATVPATVAKPKKLSVPQIIVEVARAAHLSQADIDGLLWIAKRESNYHPRSHSRSECHGLFQLSAGMAHGHPWTDPVWNTKRAIRYMKGRYGGILRAKAFWSSHHWY
jgi:hypothetical protein